MTTDCLLQGANRNPDNAQNQADDLKARNAVLAAGVIVGGPVIVAYGAPVLFTMGAAAQTVPLVGGAGAVGGIKWFSTAIISGATGAGFEYLTNPDASPASLGVAAAGGAVGGATKLGLNATFGLANQWVPTTLANFGTAIAGSQVAGGAVKGSLNQTGDSTSDSSWWTSPVANCGVYPRKPC